MCDDAISVPQFCAGMLDSGVGANVKFCKVVCMYIVVGCGGLLCALSLFLDFFCCALPLLGKQAAMGGKGILGRMPI